MKLKVFNYVDDLQEAIAFYQKAFDATIGESYKNKDGTYSLAEIRVSRGTSFWLAARNGEGAEEGGAITGEVNTGNIMQLCLMYDKKDVAKLESAYNIIKEDAQIIGELQSRPWTTHSCDLIDKYGLRWCLMVE